LQMDIRGGYRSRRKAAIFVERYSRLIIRSEWRAQPLRLRGQMTLEWGNLDLGSAFQG